MKLRNLAVAASLLTTLAACSKSGTEAESGASQAGTSSGTESSAGSHPAATSAGAEPGTGGVPTSADPTALGMPSAPDTAPSRETVQKTVHTGGVTSDTEGSRGGATR